MSSLYGKRVSSRATTHQLVLKHLLRQGPMSRSELAAATGLSNAAMTYVANELMDREILVEKRSRQVGIGRPPVPLDINYSGYHAIGLALSENHMQSVMTDLANRPVRTVSVGLHPDNPEDIVQVAADVVDFLLKYTQVPMSRLAGIGLVMPGRHDAAHGVCLSSPLFQHTNVPIAAMISDRLDTVARLDTEVNGIATAESLFGAGKSLASFGIVDVGRAFDIAFIVEGMLVRRRGGAGAGPGHIRVSGDGPACECGNDACLQSFVTEGAILSEFIRQSGATTTMTAETMRALAAMRDPVAQRVLTKAGRALGEAMITLIDVFDPEVIMVTGDNIGFGPTFFEPMLTAVSKQRPRCRIDIRWEDHTHDLRIRGAAALVLDDFFGASSRDLAVG